MSDNVSTTDAYVVGSGGTSNDCWPVAMVVDASLVVADTELLWTRRSVCSGRTRTTLGSERSG
jgi:hypothetical protein